MKISTSAGIRFPAAGPYSQGWARRASERTARAASLRALQRPPATAAFRRLGFNPAGAPAAVAALCVEFTHVPGSVRAT